MTNRSLDSKSKDWCALVGESISSLLVRFRANYPIDEWKTEGFFKEDDLLEINCFWYQFNPIPITHHLLLGIIFILLFLVGSLSNATVIYILSRWLSSFRLIRIFACISSSSVAYLLAWLQTLFDFFRSIFQISYQLLVLGNYLIEITFNILSIYQFKLVANKCYVIGLCDEC